MTATSARLAATLADRYRIERELGQGGFTSRTICDTSDASHSKC